MKLFFLFILAMSTTASAVQFASCPSSDNPVTSPATVDISALKNKIHLLQNESGTALFQSSPLLDVAINETFDTSKVKTKMEQFYQMLWVLSQELSRQKITNVSFSQKTVREVLLASKVFTDVSVPSQIKAIELDVSNKDHPRCHVIFAKKDIEIPLNQGEGFYLFRNGKCQHAEKLIFGDSFSFELKRNLGNLMVSEFSGVDLFGDFGNRGLIDVDIQYISLRSVEFLGGTVDGRVTAYVSREEFKKNNHNRLLELVTRVVPDRSVQPIDW